MQARRKWQNIFRVVKGKKLQPRILYSAKLSFKFEGEIKVLQTNKRREFLTTREALQQMLKGLLYVEKATTRNNKVMNGKAHQ